MAIRKIELMYKLYGFSPDTNDICLNCSNFDHRVGGYSKCRVYGRTSSEATDWKQKQRACGLFNKPYRGDKQVVELVNPDKRLKHDTTEGQINLFEYLSKGDGNEI